MNRGNRLLTVVAFVALAGCDSAGEEHGGDGSVVSGSGMNPSSLPGKKVDPAEAVAVGKEVFSTRCAVCHGGAGEGKKGQGPSLSAETFLAAASDDMLFKWIAQGRQGTTMIAWQNVLSADEIGSVVTYLRTLTPHEPAVLDDSPLKGDVETGERVYSSICANCHGRTGAGYQETANGTGIGRKAFLDIATDGYIRHVVNHGKSNTAMKGFEENKPTAVANLTPEEIDSVISYLRQRAW